MGKNIFRFFFTRFIGFLILFLFLVLPVDASDITSTNFIVRDPVVGTGGGYGTSTGFRIISGGETLFTDANSSTNFIGHYGFLYFPAPAVSSTGGPSGGGVFIVKRGVGFTGYAYPNAGVYLLKDGTQILELQADPLGAFNAVFEEKFDNLALYSLFAYDTDGERSLLLNYPLVISEGNLTSIKDIRFPPTIRSNKIETKKSDPIEFYGFALPRSELTLTLSGASNVTLTMTAQDDGKYNFIVDTSNLSRGEYSVSVRYSSYERVSKLVAFTLGNRNIYVSDVPAEIPGDCNRDRVINLVDFSILAFWYGKANPPTCVDTNHDSLINLIDFSVLAFYWTG